MLKLYYAVWVVYAYTIWIVAEYAWDWWKKRRRRRQAALAQQRVDVPMEQPLVQTDGTPTQVPANHPSSPVEAA